jgi:hypothetical protein
VPITKKLVGGHVREISESTHGFATYRAKRACQRTVRKICEFVRTALTGLGRIARNSSRSNHTSGSIRGKIKRTGMEQPRPCRYFRSNPLALFLLETAWAVVSQFEI